MSEILDIHGFNSKKGSLLKLHHATIFWSVDYTIILPKHSTCLLLEKTKKNTYQVLYKNIIGFIDCFPTLYEIIGQ